MHLYFISRGVKHARDIFVTTMQSQFFPWKRKNLKTGKEEITSVQGALRPVELWEYVFPEESLPEVLAMLDIQNLEEGKYGLSKSKMALLRKSLGCTKIPKIPDAEKQHIISKIGVGIHPIGIRKDKKGEMMGYEQEYL